MACNASSEWNTFIWLWSCTVSCSHSQSPLFLQFLIALRLNLENAYSRGSLFDWPPDVLVVFQARHFGRKGGGAIRTPLSMYTPWTIVNPPRNRKIHRFYPLIAKSIKCKTRPTKHFELLTPFEIRPLTDLPSTLNIIWGVIILFLFLYWSLSSHRLRHSSSDDDESHQKYCDWWLKKLQITFHLAQFHSLLNSLQI